MRSKNGWIVASKPNINSYFLPNVVKIDDKHFIIPYTRSGYLRFKKYDIKTNKWTKLHTQYKLQSISSDLQISYDAKSNCVYFLHNSKLICIEINEEENNIIIYPLNEQLQGYLDAMIMCNEYFHVFEVNWFNQQYIHYIWNNDTLTQHSSITDFSSHFKSFYVSSKKELFVVGGDTIHRFCNKEKKWNILDFKLPQKLGLFELILTSDERYVIIFHKSDIYVLDWKLMKMRKSKLRSPCSKDLTAVLMDYKEENDLLVNGFINQETKRFEMNIPLALINLIGIWVSTQYVHVISKNSCLKHHKIKIDQIFQFDGM